MMNTGKMMTGNVREHPAPLSEVQDAYPDFASMDEQRRFPLKSVHGRYGGHDKFVMLGGHPGAGYMAFDDSRRRAIAALKNAQGEVEFFGSLTDKRPTANHVLAHFATDS